MSQNNMTYEDICERLEEAAPGATVLVTSSFSSGSTKGKRTYPLAILKVKESDKLPPEVDPKNKEVGYRLVHFFLFFFLFYAFLATKLMK